MASSAPMVALQSERARELAIQRNGGRPLWSHEAWQNTISAYRSGYRAPEARYPVVISADSLLASPQDVQRLAGLKEPPATSWTTKSRAGDRSTPLCEPGAGERVLICDLAADDYWRLRHSMEAEEMFVWFRDKERSALVYRALQQRPGRLEEVMNATNSMLMSAQEEQKQKQQQQSQSEPSHKQ